MKAIFLFKENKRTFTTIFIAVFVGILLTSILAYVVFHGIIYRTTQTLNNTATLKSIIIQERLQNLEHDLEVEAKMIGSFPSFDIKILRDFHSTKAQNNPALIGAFLLRSSANVKDPSKVLIQNFYHEENLADKSLLSIASFLQNKSLEMLAKKSENDDSIYEYQELLRDDGSRQPILAGFKKIQYQDKLQQTTLVHIFDLGSLTNTLPKNTVGELKVGGHFYDKRINAKSFDEDISYNNIQISTNKIDFFDVLKEAVPRTQIENDLYKTFLSSRSVSIEFKNLIVKLQIDIVTLVNPIKITFLLFLGGILVSCLFGFLTYRGITLQRQKEQEKRLVQITKERSQFFDILAHELRTPLSGILGMAELLLKTKLDEKQKHYISTVKKSGHVMNLIVDQTLTSSRMESLNLKFIETPFSLSNLMEYLLDALGPLADIKKIQLEYNLPKELNGVTYLGDELRIRQILINLISNAIKFTNEGSVRIVLSKKDKPNDKSLSMIRFDVIDTGIGIDEREKSKLFQKFGRLNKEYQDMSDGGLGLFISQKLIRLLGGSLNLNTQAQQGSNFYFEIPIKSQEAIEEKACFDQLNGKEIVIIAPINNTDILEFKSHLEKNGAHVNLMAQYLHIREFFKQCVSKGLLPDLIYIHEKYGDDFGLDLFHNIQVWMRQELHSKVVYLTESSNYMQRLKILSTGIIQTHLIPVEPKILIKHCADILELNKSLTVSPKTNLSISQLEKFRNGLHILIADDNLVNAEILSIMLNSLGHQVKIAANGLEVMKQLEIHVFDMILMDINMPFMDGIETTQKIRQSNSVAQHIPIVAITANIGDKYSESYLSNGMNDSLIKPFSIESIEKKIADVFFQTAYHYRWNSSS